MTNISGLERGYEGCYRRFIALDSLCEINTGRMQVEICVADEKWLSKGNGWGKVRKAEDDMMDGWVYKIIINDEIEKGEKCANVSPHGPLRTGVLHGVESKLNRPNCAKAIRHLGF